MPKPKNFRISDEVVFETIIQLCAAAWPDETVRPEEIAMTLHEVEWQALTKRIRLAVKQLAEAGHVQILRKGSLRRQMILRVCIGCGWRIRFGATP